MLYGVATMNHYFVYSKEKLFAKFNVHQPERTIEGIIMIISNSRCLPYLHANWKLWGSQIQNNLNKTQIVYVSTKPLEWYPNSLVIPAPNCSEHIYDHNCKTLSSIPILLKLFPKVKWILKLEPTIYLNVKGFENFINNLDAEFPRKPLLRSSIRHVGGKYFMDHRSGWFMSRRTAIDWVNIINGNFSHSEATDAIFKPLGTDIKSVADERYIPSSFYTDELMEILEAPPDECPKYYRYFGIVNKNVVKASDAITVNLEGSEAEIKMSAQYFDILSKQSFGFTTENSDTHFCTISEI